MSASITRLEQPPQPDAFGIADSPLGFFLCAWQGDLLVRLHLLPAHSETKPDIFLKDYGWPASLSRDDSRAAQLVQNTLFKNGVWQPDAAQHVKMGFYGTDFQFTTLGKMLAIPSGETRAYRQLSNAARAVGTVCANNPLCFLVPCHRVTAMNDLGGYGYGLALKRQLLRWEGAIKSI